MDDDDDDIPLIYICRNIPGEHIGGPKCFCCPTVHRADEDVATILAASRAASRMS